MEKKKSNLEESIITYKFKYFKDLTPYFEKAKLVAEFAIANRTLNSSKFVSHIGLPSVISNQILRKFNRDLKCKSVKHANLLIPGQSLNYDSLNHLVEIPCLKLTVKADFSLLNYTFIKLNSAEIKKDYIYFQVSVKNQKVSSYDDYLGIDRNATRHIAVCANGRTGKILKLGAKAPNVSKTLKKHRAKLQKNKKYNHLKKVAKRESRINADINHKISRNVVDYAYRNKLSIKLEDLKGVRKNKKTAVKQNKTLNHVIHSWSFYQLQTFIVYKARLLGIKVFFVDPFMTSQTCSKCGARGSRTKEKFKCHSCQHSDNPDVNAAFNIANAKIKKNGYMWI